MRCWGAGHFVTGVSSLAGRVQTLVMDSLQGWTPPPFWPCLYGHRRVLEYIQTPLERLHQRPAEPDKIVRRPHDDLKGSVCDHPWPQNTDVDAWNISLHLEPWWFWFFALSWPPTTQVSQRKRSFEAGGLFVFPIIALHHHQIFFTHNPSKQNGILFSHRGSDSQVWVDIQVCSEQPCRPPLTPLALHVGWSQWQVIQASDGPEISLFLCGRFTQMKLTEQKNEKVEYRSQNLAIKYQFHVPAHLHPRSVVLVVLLQLMYSWFHRVRTPCLTDLIGSLRFIPNRRQEQQLSL